MREIWISNLTQYTAKAVSDRTEAITKPFTDSLINAIVVPFDDFTTELDKILDASDLGKYLSDNWQEIIFQQQAALAAAVIIALIYVILVPTAGFFVACSEWCCIVRCQKNARCCSCCGIFNRIATGISAICVIIGGCMVFVVNSRVDQAISSIPDEFQTTIEIPSSYLKNINGQLDVYFRDYKSFTDVNMNQLTNGQIGENTEEIVKDAFADTNSSITDLIPEVENSIQLVTALVDEFDIVLQDAKKLAVDINSFKANNTCGCSDLDSIANEICENECDKLFFEIGTFTALEEDIGEIYEGINAVNLSSISNEIDNAINQKRF